MGPCFRRDDSLRDDAFILLTLPAAAYWIARSSRAMTVEFDAGDYAPNRRPRERGDPYAVPSRCDTGADTFCNHEGLWLWVPAFAGTTCGEMLHPLSSPSLPRRDDLDLVAVLERRLRPLAARQHVEIQRDGEMGALIFELAEQRVDAARGDLPLLAVDDHTHCMTSLSIWPRSTKASVNSASAGAIRKPWR